MAKIPFEWMPGSWGLKGKTREIAKAEYELTGYDLEAKLLEFKVDDLEGKDYRRKVLDLDLKYNKVTREEYDRSIIRLIDDEKQKELALAELDYREGKIKEKIGRAHV